MTDLEASLGLEGIENFWWTFDTRKKNLNRLLDLTKDLQDYAWFNLEEPGEVTCPHAFSITVKDPKYDAKALSEFLEDKGIKCKRNFGCIPTQHAAFAWMGHKEGDFPASEYVGSNGLHFGCHQYLTDDDLVFASDCLHEYFGKF
jgi:dTDP-4-amino-4,6-dideoxygalactose transaminase